MQTTKIFIISFSLFLITDAAYISLISSLPKCVVIEAPPPTTIEVEYESPDIKVTNEVEEDRIGRRPGRDGIAGGPGLDSMTEMASDSRRTSNNRSQPQTKEDKILSNFANIMGSTHMTIVEFDKNAKPKKVTQPMYISM